MVRRTLLVFLVALIAESTSAQSFFAIRQDRKWILTAGTGTSTYYGELTNPGLVLKPQPNLNVGIMRYYTPIFSVRAEMNWFILKGSDNIANDVGRKERALAFRSSCFELSAVGQISLYANGNRYYRRPTLNVYAFGGLGFLYFNPVADYQGKAYALEPLHTEGKSYSRVTPVIPFGIGGRYKITPNMNLAIEAGYRKTFTDYLDDVSGKYVAANTGDPVRDYFINPNPSNGFVAGSKRGNPGENDSYFLLNAKVEYYLPYNGTRKSNGVMYKKRKSTFRYNKRGGIRRK